MNKKIEMTLTHKLTQLLSSLFRINTVFADEQDGDVNTQVAEPVVTTTQPKTEATQPVVGVQNDPVNTSNASTISFEQLIGQARQEEKNKLYPQITSLKAEVSNLTQKNNTLLLSLGEKENTIQDLTNQLNLAKTNQGDPQVITDLKAKIAELEKINTELTSQIEGEKLEKFKKTEISKLNGQVIEEMITGTTEEEILASIKKANEVFLSVVSKAGGVPSTNQPPVANPSSNAVFASASVSSEQVTGMSMSDYAKYRKSLGLK